MDQDPSRDGGEPFSLDPDPRYLYRSASHGAVVDRLQQAIRSRDGFVLVTGEPGTGKTTVCRAVVEQLDRRTFTSLVHGPSHSEEQLLRVVLQDFGLVSRDEMKRGRLAHASKQELLRTLDEFLGTLRPLGAAAVLIIDEAQDMPLENLEQIVALAGSEPGKDKPLQVVLVGRPILEDLLASPLVRELDAKIATRVELLPLTAEETDTYVSHRLNIGGAQDVQFEPAAAAVVHRYSGGVPRLINMVCGNALASAQRNGSNHITAQVIDSVATKMELRPPKSPPSSSTRKRLVWAAGGIVATLVVIGILALRSDTTEPLGAAEPGAAVAASPGRQTGETPGVPAPTLESPPARSETQPEPAAVPPATGAAFSVLVASFRQTREADALIQELRKRGLPVREIRVVSSPRGVWHQVLVGPYADETAAARGREQVRQIRGYADAHVVPG